MSVSRSETLFADASALEQLIGRPTTDLREGIRQALANAQVH